MTYCERGWKRRHLLALAAVGVAGVIASCGTKPNPAQKTVATTQGSGDAASAVLWTVRSARHQASYAKMDLPVVIRGMRIEVGMGTGPSPWDGPGITVFSSHMRRSTVEGPFVDQLTGGPRSGSDGGSFLIPLPEEAAKGGGEVFEVGAPMPLYMKVEVSAVQAPGKYLFPVTITAPERAPLTTAIEVDVSELALPTEPRVLAAATTTTADLARIFPQTFGVVVGPLLDRAEPDDAAAIDQLDTLVRAAHQAGVALFVEDLGPRVKIDNVGAVTLDWDAYDRVMQPYMDGTAFADRVPQAVWLAPVPPRRLSDSPNQLRQFVAGCADHFVAKGWVATPAFMHPALVQPEYNDAARDKDEALRKDIQRVFKLHMSREMLAVTNPDATVPQSRLWVVDDSDPRLPPAGALATERSVRVWPWVCAARTAGAGVKGFVWRNSVARATASAEHWALFMVNENASRAAATTAPGGEGGGAALPHEEVYPSLRLAWLTQGLNDTAMLGLLERRSDPSVVNEVLGGIVGRTGLTVTPEGGEMPTAPAGYLYAGWPSDPATWAALPGMLEKLVLANAPGQQVIVSPDDPLYISAKLWLAHAHRPVARVSGFRFGLRGGSEGPVVDTAVDLLVENPVDSAVEMEGRFSQLPGDFGAVALVGGKTARDLKMTPYGVKRLLLPVAGNLDALVQSPRQSALQLSEQTGGSVLRLPVRLPIYRMKMAASPPKLDGHGSDWIMDNQTRSFGLMTIADHYLSRPDLLSGTVRKADDPATARWSYDANNIYVLIRCPETVVSDERNTDWPEVAVGGGSRWWGTDGVEIQMANPNVFNDPDGGQIMTIAFKPGGVAMTRVATVKGATLSGWTEGPEGVKYGISIEKQDGRVKGYVVEAAIPRAWFGKTPSVQGLSGPALRVNVLWHRANDLTSMSWSGPVVDDQDVSMMGLLLGNE